MNVAPDHLDRMGDTILRLSGHLLSRDTLEAALEAARPAKTHTLSERMAEALRPFARIGANIPKTWRRDVPLKAQVGAGVLPLVSDYDRAAEALAAYSAGGRGEAADDAVFIEQGNKALAMRQAGPPFIEWLTALAKIADPDDPAGWLAGSVVLNEDCWFDYYSDGFTPGDCWREECSCD